MPEPALPELFPTLPALEASKIVELKRKLTDPQMAANSCAIIAIRAHGVLEASKRGSDFLDTSIFPSLSNDYGKIEPDAHDLVKKADFWDPRSESFLEVARLAVGIDRDLREALEQPAHMWPSTVIPAGVYRLAVHAVERARTTQDG